MPSLFSPIAIRGLTIPNRIVLSPMCVWVAGDDGLATDWHFVHYGARAIGRCGLVLTEAVAVEPRGRITTSDLGLWSDDHIGPLARIVRFCHGEGVAIGVQLGHAGRKAFSPDKGRGPQAPVAPSAIPFADDWVTPRELDETEIERIVEAWRAAARRAGEAGFDLIEIHDAHGYLMHEFLSPVSNKRTDAYGGSLENRSRLLLRVVDAVRSVWPAKRPLFLRVSSTDWVPGGLTPPNFVALAPRLCERGVDLLDCSSGGIVTGAPPAEAMTPGFQVPFAEEIRRDGGIPTMAVGLITEPAAADAIIASGQADLVAIGREMLRDPQWPLRAARALGQAVGWPKSYERGK